MTSHAIIGSIHKEVIWLAIFRMAEISQTYKASSVKGFHIIFSQTDIGGFSWKFFMRSLFGL
jgi:hypothetical protein